MVKGNVLQILTTVVFITELNGIFAFDYHHPELWSKEQKECAENRQSPVNVPRRKIKETLPNKLVISNYDTKPTGVKVTNNGHTVAFSPIYQLKKPSIQGGPLNGVYVLDSFHFHWGLSNANGSEHTLDGRHYQLEMHLVHYKEGYGSMKGAMGKPDGLSVIGVFFSIPTTKNPKHSALDPIVNLLSKVKDVETTVNIPPFLLSTFGLQTPQTYVTYQGSLTTPPCSQVVTWLLSLAPHVVTNQQMQAFRAVKLEHLDKENDRPQQPINRRVFKFVNT
ncbi:carbonic anhydrase 2-like [Belonocnema kinseyi]|uniref:carbonic anhydrase 2-like n=1 Tax=Belonocnema kinseyi TaxID=2817044 RepID=UPI00143D28B2|nr:carbonic anhydrase 2-like [Belonocnema kinseyi]